MHTHLEWPEADQWLLEKEREGQAGGIRRGLDIVLVLVICMTRNYICFYSGLLAQSSSNPCHFLCDER